MNRIKIKTPADLLQFLKRRVLWIVIPFVTISLLVTVVSLRLPNMFVSDAFIVVEPQKIPESYVKSPLSVDTTERLNTLGQEILSWSNLYSILREFKPYESKHLNLSEEDKVKLLRRNIGLNIQAGRVPYFLLFFQHRDPMLAKVIADRLALMFIDIDVKVREYRIKGTAEFLDSELDALEKDLKEPETKMVQFRKENYNQLPEMLEANLRTLEMLHQQLRANTESLDRSEAQRRSLEQQLAKTKPTLEKDELLSRPDIDSHLAFLLTEQATKKAQMRTLKLRYTDNHPDVLALKKGIEKLENEIKVTQANDGDGKLRKLVNNPTYINLVEQLNTVNNEISARRVEKKKIESDIVSYSARVENTPRVEMERSAIMKGYASLKELYNSLLTKKQEARLANDLELRQKGEQFRIRDSASLPTSPTGPDRIRFIVIGMFLSLALGAGLAIGVELLDEQILNEAEVTNFLNLPVLVEIPEIVTEGDVRMKKIKRSALLLVFGILAAGYAGLLVLLASDNRFSRMIIEHITVRFLFY